MITIYPKALPIALSLTGYNAFLTGLLVMLKRRDKGGVRYFIANFFIFLWGMGLSFMLNNDLPVAIAQKWGVFSQIAALFIPATWLHFVVTYTGREEKYKLPLAAAYAATLIIFPFCFTRFFVSGFTEKVGILNYPAPGYAFTAFALFFIVTVSFSFLVFYRALFDSRGNEEKRKDFKLVCLASLYGFGTGSLSFLPVYGIPFPQYNLVVMPLWQILLAYGMIRYRIFDMEEIAQAVRRDKLAAVGTLAASINHEIRNPLYVIQGLAESHLVNMEEGVYKTSEQTIARSKEVLSKAMAQATRAMDIMKRFSLFAKQNADQQPKLEKVNISDALDGILPLVRHEMDLDKIRFTKDIPADFPLVNVDRRHLEEILFNLILNSCQALKHSKCESPVIEISALAEAGKKHIFVRDNGPGIPVNELKKIFQPFYTTKEEGTGLGLYITKQLMEKNKAKLDVESQPGKGTQFCLVFS